MRSATTAFLLIGAGLVTLAGPALAQSTPEGVTNSIEEIVVTAERRTERLQDVPLTVNVVSSEQLAAQNIETTSDLVKAVPSLMTTNFGVFQIRGIGTEGFGKSAEQSVSVVLDGVVLGRALTNSMYDLDHVEVLSGPQGTLFGKNSTGGVVSIVTKAPKLGQYEFSGHVDAGNHDYVHSYLIGNIPLGDDAALRISGHHDSSGRIVYNTLFNKWDYNTDDGVRARLLWKPRDDLTVNFSADYQQLGSNGVNGVADFAGVAVYDKFTPGSPLAATLAACGVTPGPNNNRDCANSLTAAGVSNDVYGTRYFGGATQVDYDFGGFTATSITAIRYAESSDFNVDADIAGVFGDTLPLNVFDRNLVPYSDRTISEEARIQSPITNPVNFVAGVYYATTHTHDKIDQSGQLGIPLPSGIEVRRVNQVIGDQKNYAVFGQVNYRATDKFEFLAGGRVTHDQLRDRSFNLFPDPYDGVTGHYIYGSFFELLPVNQSASQTGVSWKFGTQYHATPDVMLFATVTRGYKGPYINDQASPPILESQLLVHPEYPLAYEFGVKSTLFKRLALNVSLFHDKIRDFQTTIFLPPSPSNPITNFIQGNAPYAITQGVDFNAFGNVTEHFSMNVAMLFNDAHYSNGFLVSCDSSPCPANSQLSYAPKWKGTLTGEYSHPVGAGLEGYFQSDVVYKSVYPYVSRPDVTLKSPSRTVFGARLGVRPQNERWGVAVFCRNCFNRRYPVNEVNDGFSAIDGGAPSGTPISKQPSTMFLSLDSYRLVGASIDAHF